MANSHLLEARRATEATAKLQIATLIRDLSRSVEVLTVDIDHMRKHGQAFETSQTRPIRCWRGASGREGRTLGPPLPCWRTFGPKSQRTRYDGTRGGVGNQLTEHRARGVSRIETRLPLCANSNKIPHRTEVTRWANNRHPDSSNKSPGRCRGFKAVWNARTKISTP